MCLSIPSQPFSSVNPSNLFFQALWEQLGAISSEVPTLPLGFHSPLEEMAASSQRADPCSAGTTAVLLLPVSLEWMGPHEKPLKYLLLLCRSLNLGQRENGKSTGRKSREWEFCNSSNQTQAACSKLNQNANQAAPQDNRILQDFKDTRSTSTFTFSCISISQLSTAMILSQYDARNLSGTKSRKESITLLQL